MRGERARARGASLEEARARVADIVPRAAVAHQRAVVALLVGIDERVGALGRAEGEGG